MPLRYEPNPSGGITFHDDDQGTSFTAYGPAAQSQALKIDAANGQTQPIDFYQGLGRPQPLATSPEALADASGATGGGDAGKVSGALFGPTTPAPLVSSGPAEQTTSPVSGLPPITSPPTLSSGPTGRAAEAAIAQAGTPGGDAGKVQGALGFAPVNVPGVEPMQLAPGLSTPSSRVLALRLNGQQKEGDALGKVDPKTVQTFPVGARPPGGAPAGTGNPVLDRLVAQALQPGQLVRTPGGWIPSTKTVRSEIGPDVESFHMLGAKSQERAGIQAEGAEGRAKQAEKQADVLSEVVPVEQAALAKANAELERNQRAYDAADADIAARRKELAEAKIKPNQFFSSMSAGEDILSMLSIIAGSIGQALTGGKSNVAMDVFSRRVEQDIQAQRDNLEQGNRNLSASERQLDLNAKRLGSMEAALDYQRRAAHEAAGAKLKVLLAEAKSEDERQHARELIAQNDERLYEIAMKQNAARNGEQVYSQRYQAPGVTRVGGMSVGDQLKVAGAATDQTKANAQARKDAKEGAVQTGVYNGQRVAFRDEIGSTEAGKFRVTLGSLESLKRQVARLDELNTIKGRLSPEQSKEREGLVESIGAEWSTAKGQGVVTNQQAERLNESLGSFLGGKGGGRALVESVDATARGIISQSGAGIVNDDGSVVPFAGQ
jgi:hypothetical protein